MKYICNCLCLKGIKNNEKHVSNMSDLQTNKGMWIHCMPIVKLPHASGHSSGNRQGHVTKIKTHRFEIFVAFRFTNV